MTQAQYAQAPDRLSVRELQVGGKTLVTTLLCAKLTPKSELKSLYQQRWHVELNFRNLKTTMGLEILSSKSPPWRSRRFGYTCWPTISSVE